MALGQSTVVHVEDGAHDVGVCTIRLDPEDAPERHGDTRPPPPTTPPPVGDYKRAKIAPAAPSRTT